MSPPAPAGAPVLRLALDPRGYELDADALAPPGAFARWLEHARWTALADLAATVPLFSRGVVRAQRWRWEAPVRFGDALEITTWIGRVGRTSFDFVHRVRRHGDGALVAFTAATVVRLGAAGPEPLPAEARALVVEDDAPETRPLALDAPPPGCARFRRIVTASDLDLYRHVNQARWVDLLDDARQLAAPGARPTAMHVDHLGEALPGADLTAHALELPDGAVGAFVTGADGRPLAKARFETTPPPGGG